MEKLSKLKSHVQVQDHQTSAGDRMKSKGGVLVYHGLGSGKSLTSLAATQGMDTDVVVPASLRENYKKETKKFTTDHKPNVMSYEKATKDKADGKGKALVVDEAQMMGRQDSARAKDMFDLGKKYDYRMLLSGTPIRNDPSELAPLINTVRGQKVLPTSKAHFDQEYIDEEKVSTGILARILHGAKPGVRYRIKNKAKLTSLLDGYVDYYKPSQENFPSVSHEVVETPMSNEQKKYYDFVMNKAGPALRWKIKMGLPPSKQEAKTMNSFMSGTRQISNSTAPFGGKEVSPKITKAVVDLKRNFKKDKNFKGLVYSNFLDAGVKNYAEQLDHDKIPYGIYDGSLSDKKRKDLIKAYNSGVVKVLLVSGAGSQGLDLKGTKLVQLLEPHWNESRLEQATGRAARYMSHAHLPEDERHVHVQRYMSTLPKTLLQKALNMKQKDMSADQYLDMLSKDKEALNEQFYDVLRTVGSKKMEKKAKEILHGGKADNVPDSAFGMTKVLEGMQVEREHTKSKEMQKEIAKDHLTEDSNYYQKLKKMEKKAEDDNRVRDYHLNKKSKDELRGQTETLDQIQRQHFTNHEIQPAAVMAQPVKTPTKKEEKSKPAAQVNINIKHEKKAFWNGFTEASLKP